MKLRCKNSRCIKSNNGKSYEWDYQGKNPFYASCPRCKSTIKIEQKKKLNSIELKGGIK